MYMNLKANLIFCSGPPPPPQLFWSEIFRSPLKLGGGAATMLEVSVKRWMKYFIALIYLELYLSKP